MKKYNLYLFLLIVVSLEARTDLGNGFYLEENNVTITCDTSAVYDQSNTPHNGKLYTKIGGRTDLVTHGGSISAEYACTSRVSDMSSWFQGQPDFNKDISHWDTSSVTQIYNIFFGASSFNQDIGEWNISTVSSLSGVFANASSFEQDVSRWDTSGVTVMAGLFYKASTFNQDISDWNTSLVTNMSNMFFNAESFNQDIGNWDTSLVTNMDYMFLGASSFNQCLKRWNVQSNPTHAQFEFSSGFENDATKQPNWGDVPSECTQDTGLGNGFSVAENNVTILCESASVGAQSNIAHNGRLYTKIDDKLDLGTHGGSVDATNACTSGVTNMASWFQEQMDFDKDIAHWDTSRVSDMSNMFLFARSFNHDISEWNTSNVTFMNGMFMLAGAFNQDIGEWDTSRVTDMNRMFSRNTFNQDISQWNTSSVLDMFKMFESNTALINPLEHGIRVVLAIWGTCLPKQSILTKALVIGTPVV